MVISQTILPILRNNIQKFLAIIMVLTYGLADAYTSARMMELKGFQIESNYIAAHVYMTQGFWGVISIKLFYALAVLFLIYLIQCLMQNIYWKINGFLIVTSLFGLLASIANMNAIEEQPNIFSSIVFEPTYFVVMYMVSLIIFITIGDFFDRKQIEDKI